ncbi:MAG: site-specific DNA-methyltransferase [Planctomycetaceae bacterium]|nr:MAG: site-specific DNA-methyltransferase [Planctomycetaceae bacterium]
MAEMPESSVDAIVTDPPYGLEFMGKEWDKLLVRERDAAYPSCRHAHGPNAYLAGTKAQDWHYTWAVAALRVLKPGGHALVFGGTRTFHRLTCALEDAGFEIRDCLSWLYGSGFPKSLDVSKAIDAQQQFGGSNTRRLKAANEARPGTGRMRATTRNNGILGDEHGPKVTRDIPLTDAARQWEGWGTALKPAWEPIILARKPLTGTVAATVQEWGTGALNIDGCRIGTETRPALEHTGRSGKVYGAGLEGSRSIGTTTAGRWPANLLLECTCEETREGRVVGKAAERRTPANRQATYGGFDMCDGHVNAPNTYADTVRIHTDPDCPCAMLDAQSGERPGMASQVDTKETPSRYFGLDKHPGTRYGRGDSGGASRFFYCAKASSAERNGSKHPTVKPLDLMRYLCRLVTPPDGLILDPFAGSATTLEAAHLEGFRCMGIEMSEEYCADAKARLGKYLL